MPKMSFFGISMPQNVEIHQNLEIDFLHQCNIFSIEKVKSEKNDQLTIGLTVVSAAVQPA